MCVCVCGAFTYFALNMHVSKPKLIHSFASFLTTSYYETHHNFFAYADQGMKNDFNGHDNHHHHNVYAFINRGMGIGGTLPGHNDYFYENRVVQNNNGGYANYDCSCSSTTCPILHDNTIFTKNGEMENICGKTLPERQAEGIDVGTSVAAWPDDDDIIGWARELLDLPPQ